MQTDPILLDRARTMRAGMPQPERDMWLALRGRQLDGTKFARQVPVGPYVADFCARAHRLIVKIDGHTHIDLERDEYRTAWLTRNGYRVVRFTNTDVSENMEGVLFTIRTALAIPSPDPLPTGERASPGGERRGKRHSRPPRLG